MLNWLKNTKPAPPARVDPVIGNVTEYNDVPSSDAVRMGEIFGSLRTSAGPAVNERTAMRSAAAYACVRLISGAIASMPADIYRKTDSGNEKVKHSYTELLNEQPTPRFSAATFWEFIVTQVLFRGDGIAYLVRPNQYSLGVKAIIPVPRSNVVIKRQGDRLVYFIEDIDNDSGESKYFAADQSDILHFPGYGYNGRESLSVIAWAARQAIGTSLAGDEFAGSFFGSGAHIQHALTTPKTMTLPQQEAFREAWVAKYSGHGISNIPLILTEGLDLKELTMTAADSQLLESRKFQVIDIARAFGVPPFMIGEVEKTSSWGSGIEQMGIGFVKYTLQPHLTRFEQELNRKLFPTIDRYAVKFNVDGLERGDSKSRADYYKAALGGTQSPGWLTQNDVRRQENYPTMEGGDTLFKPVPGAKNAQPNEDDNATAGAPDAGKQGAAA
jgi:HK97 family phage portal protein